MISRTNMRICNVSVCARALHLSSKRSVATPVVARNARAVAQGRASVTTMAFFGSGTKTASNAPIYDITVKDIDGRDLKFSKFAGKVVLVCNVASECGFTPQYTELAGLYNKYNSKGLVVLGAPCNQFGAQEPGSDADIKKFAASKGAKFPLMAKADVNGVNATPLFEYLKKQKGGLLTADIKWNFTKFLVDREGNVVGRYPSTTSPSQIENDILKYL